MVVLRQPQRGIGPSRNAGLAIARGVARVSMVPAGRGLALSALGVGGRHIILFGTLAVVLGSGAADPIALMAGVSVLPPIIIALGLSGTRLLR